jgi:hypothetical protein
MVELYLDSTAGTQVRSAISSSDGKGLLEGYAHEALSMSLFSSSRHETYLDVRLGLDPPFQGVYRT